MIGRNLILVLTLALAVTSLPPPRVVDVPRFGSVSDVVRFAEMKYYRFLPDPEGVNGKDDEISIHQALLLSEDLRIVFLYRGDDAGSIPSLDDYRGALIAENSLPKSEIWGFNASSDGVVYGVYGFSKAATRFRLVHLGLESLEFEEVYRGNFTNRNAYRPTQLASLDLPRNIFRLEAVVQSSVPPALFLDWTRNPSFPLSSDGWDVRDMSGSGSGTRTSCIKLEKPAPGRYYLAYGMWFTSSQDQPFSLKVILNGDGSCKFDQGGAGPSRSL